MSDLIGTISGTHQQFREIRRVLRDSKVLRIAGVMYELDVVNYFLGQIDEMLKGDRDAEPV